MTLPKKLLITVLDISHKKNKLKSFQEREIVNQTQQFLVNKTKKLSKNNKKFIAKLLTEVFKITK